MKSLLLFLFIPFTIPPIPYRQLTWEDYKGKPEAGSTIARSYTGIVIEKDTAYAIFEPGMSWTKTNSVVTLRHEQGHFAITKMYAQFITEDMNKKDHHRLSEYLLENWGRTEDRYDEETDHGNNLEKQKEWEERIKL